MKVRVMDPKHGDQVLQLKPAKAAKLIIAQRKKGLVSFVKFSDGTTWSGNAILDMMDRTGILSSLGLQRSVLEQKLEEKDRLGVDATLVPAVGGG